MSTIFVLGATGFGGFPIATALRRAGYFVYGHARSSEKAKLLAQNEIIPIQGDIKNLSEWLPQTVEIVIDVSGLNDEAVELLEQCKKIGSARKATDPKLGFIYTSGMGVYGSSSTFISESTPLNLHAKAVDAVSWRPEIENQILASRDVLDIAIVRPALLYGGNGSLMKIWLEPVRQATANSASVAGNPSSPVTLIHKDDLGDLYVKLVERFTVVAASTYPVLNVASHQEQLGDIVSAFAKAIKFEGDIVYKAPSNLLEEALATSLNFRPNKARGVLGWVPKQIPFVQGVGLYEEAYNAWN